MGFTSSWLAIEDGDPAQILRALALIETGEVLEEWWDPGVCWLRRGRWIVVFRDGSRWDPFRPEQAAALSRGHRVLCLEQSDTTMVDTLTGFEGGVRVWEVGHDGERADTPWLLGPAPAPYPPILADCRRRQAESEAGVDHLYEVVPELGQALVGFRHDEPTADDGFHTLR